MPPKRLPEPPGGTFDQAGPSQPRRRGERRARYRAPDILVDVTFHAIADVGSIPTVSTPGSGASVHIQGTEAPLSLSAPHDGHEAPDDHLLQAIGTRVPTT